MLAFTEQNYYENRSTKLMMILTSIKIGSMKTFYGLESLMLCLWKTHLSFISVQLAFLEKILHPLLRILKFKVSNPLDILLYQLTIVVYYQTPLISTLKNMLNPRFSSLINMLTSWISHFYLKRHFTPGYSLPSRYLTWLNIHF